MDATKTNVDLRRSAMCRIGRNVVNFQKLELCLKFIAQFGRIEGSISKAVSDHEKRTAKAAHHTLGQAIQEWQKVVMKDQSPNGAIADLFEPWLSMTFDIEMDKEKAKAQGNTLFALATERNNLIHHDLASIDFGSATQCQELIAKLDDQNAKILEQLRILAPLKESVRELSSVLHSFFQSDEFLNLLNGSSSEDNV